MRDGHDDEPFPRRCRLSSFALTFAAFAPGPGRQRAPTPLYARYAQTWHLSAGALTVVFAVYAIALLLGAEETVQDRTPFVIRLSLGVPRSTVAAFLAALPACASGCSSAAACWPSDRC